MAATSALLRGLVSRLLPQPTVDGTDQEKSVRLGRYGDIKVENAWPTDHMLADEGAVIVAGMASAATALAPGFSAAPVDTLPTFMLVNSDIAGGKRIYPKFLKLNLASAGTTPTTLRYSIVLDSKDRTPTSITAVATPGTNSASRYTPVCTNMDVTPTIIGVPYFTSGATGNTGAITVPASGATARTVVANGMLRNAIPVALDQYVIQFGGCDIGGHGVITLTRTVDYTPPFVIGPGQTALIYIWSAGNTGTSGHTWGDVQLCWVEK